MGSGSGARHTLAHTTGPDWTKIDKVTEVLVIPHSLNENHSQERCHRADEVFLISCPSALGLKPVSGLGGGIRSLSVPQELSPLATNSMTSHVFASS